MSPPIQERSPGPYLALNPTLAGQLGVQAGDFVLIDVLGRSLRLPAFLLDSLADGAVGLPAGLPGIPVGLPALSKISRQSGTGEGAQV